MVRKWEWIKLYKKKGLMIVQKLKYKAKLQNNVIVLLKV